MISAGSSSGEPIVKHSIFRAFGSSGGVFPQDTEEPIRSELFSIERLECTVSEPSRQLGAGS